MSQKSLKTLHQTRFSDFHEAKEFAFSTMRDTRHLVLWFHGIFISLCQSTMHLLDMECAVTMRSYSPHTHTKKFLKKCVHLKAYSYLTGRQITGFQYPIKCTDHMGSKHTRSSNTVPIWCVSYLVTISQANTHFQQEEESWLKY